MYKNILKFFYNSGVYLLMTLTITVLLTSLLWILNISISYFHLPISFIISAIIFYLFFEKNKKSYIFTIIISLIIFVCSVLVAGHTYDQSDDGNSYHKETVYSMTTGWNPIYNDYKTFAKKHDLTYTHELWAEHYPKTTWIISSNVYKITGNIETGKCYNLLLIYIAFTIFSYLFSCLLNKKILNLIISLIIALNPIVISQVFSYYVDGFLGLILYLIIFYMYLFVKNDEDWKIKIILASLLLLIINVKFTGLMYSGLFCLGYFIYYAIKKIKNKEYKILKNNFIYFVIVVLISICVAGSNSYIRNIVTDGNPLYPLFGKDKVDIITYLQPESFAEKTPVEKTFYSIFSWSANIGVFNGGEPILKKPFEYSINEINNLGYDTRIGGYGVLFGGIIIISIVIIFISIIFDIIHKNNNIWFYTIPLFISLLLLFFFSEGWWARYAPHLYLFPIFALIILGLKEKILYKILFIILSFIILKNSYYTFTSYYNSDLKNSGYTRMELNKVANEKIDIYVISDRFTGLLANLNDKNIEYKIVDKKTDDMKKLYGEFVYYKK